MSWPNWNSDEDYGFTESLSCEGWAWEFLRRNEDYRAAWKNYLEQASNYEEKYGEDWEENRETWVYHPDRRPDETPRDWGRRATLEEPVFWDERFRNGMARRWHLIEMTDPELSYDEHSRAVRFRRPRDFPVTVSDLIEAERFLDANEEFSFLKLFDGQFTVLAFDLSVPIADQIDAAKAALLQRQAVWTSKKKPPSENPKPSTWRLYLRVLDGAMSGKKQKVIGVTLDFAALPEDGLSETSDNQLIQRTKDYVRRARRQSKNYLAPFFSDVLTPEGLNG